jgi:hypothetical protein
MTLFFLVVPKPRLRNSSKVACCPFLPEESFDGSLV